MPTFISSSLTVELKPQLAAWADRNAEELLEHVSSALYDGYQFSCKAEEVGFQASLRATESVKITSNQGKMLVERAGTPQRAICRLFWAHEELFERKWPGGVKAVEDDW